MSRNGNLDDGQSIEGEYLPAVPVPPKRRRFRLTDARGVRRELAGLYAELRNGELDLNTAKAAAFILRCLLESIRTDEIESRLQAIEKRQST